MDEDDIDFPQHEPGSWGIFTDSDQALQHLNYRIVLFNGRAAQVSMLNGPGGPGAKATVSLNDPHNGGFTAEPLIDDPGFNSFRFDPLGWINHSAGPIFAEVLPIRQTKRGYGNENVRMWGFNPYSEHLGPPDGVTINNLFFSEGFQEMLRNGYPPVESVAKALFGRTDIGMAIGRRYMLHSDGDGYTWLWRDCNKIGMLSNEMTIQLSQRWVFLREEAQEAACLQGVYIQ